MKTGMIISLGGSPEPIVHSINQHRPGLVCFLVTQESVDQVAKVKAGLSYLPADHKVLVGDPNELLDCFDHSLFCWQHLMERGVDPGDVLIDFTGGTKVMSAALALLGILKGCRFSYVGGTERTKGGVGTVVTGSERVFENANPWEAHALNDERLAVSYFNQHRFQAAQDTFQAAHNKTGHLNRPLAVSFSGLASLAQAYQSWEGFRHKEARDGLNRAYDGLKNYQDISGDPRLRALLPQVQRNLDFLNGMAGQSQGFRNPCRAYVMDLVANGRRRANTGDFDDAALRLYRALEMQAQTELRTKHGINTSEVSPEKVPGTVREEFLASYADRDGKLRVPLEGSYRLLSALGNPLGQRFDQMQEQFKKVQSARNSSWLAHGTGLVSEGSYGSLLQLTLDLCQVTAEELPVFPQMSR
jgi:CRISPR-associated protein (TIGR02710 family)